MFSRARRRSRGDSGFSLIELVVALSIAMVIFSAMAAAAIAGVRASVVARQNQQAGDIINQVVEEGRGYSFTSLAMVPSDLSFNDTAVSTGATPSYTVPNGIGNEPVFKSATGSITPHVVTKTGSSGVQYTVKKYVTVPTAATIDSAGQPSQKRYTVVITWTIYGQLHTRVISTLVTETVRGLPLPRYSVSATSPKLQSKNPGASVTWGFQVVNRGARDTFNISASSGTWSYLVDSNCNGSVDSGETTALSNTDATTGDTQPDTGPLEPNNYPAYCVTATKTLPATEPLATSTVTFTFTSSAQPYATGAVVTSPVYTLTVVSGVAVTTGPSACIPNPTIAAQGTGTTLTSFGLRNGSGTSGNTTSQLVNSFNLSSCLAQAAEYNFSTEATTGTIGRSLTVGGSATSSTAAQMAEWRWNPPSTKIFNGSAAASLLVSCPTVGSNIALNVAIGTFTAKNSVWTSNGTGSTIVSCATANNWTRVEIPVPIAGTLTIQNKSQGQPQYLSMRLWTAGAAGANLRVKYESPTAKSFLSIAMG